MARDVVINFKNVIINAKLYAIPAKSAQMFLVKLKSDTTVPVVTDM